MAQVETPQDVVRQFFWELDKLLGPNHPFIVLHGPADTFKEYLKHNIKDVRRLGELEETNEDLEDEIEELKDEVKVMEDGIRDAIKGLQGIDAENDTQEELKEQIEELITSLKDVL